MRLVDHLEQLWNEIREAHTEIPTAVIITGQGTSKSRRARHVRLGHFRPGCWQTFAGERDPEVFIAGETIAAGPEMVLETMLHEAAHALGAVRGIKNTSASGGQWHNKKFAALAREVGLEPPERAQPPLGFSECKLTRAALAHYGPVLGLIERGRLASLPDDGEPVGDPNAPRPTKPAGEKTGGKRVACECGCLPTPRRLQLTPKQLAEGAVLCGNCGEPFTPPVAAEEAQAQPVDQAAAVDADVAV